MVDLELFNFLKKYPKTENGKHTHIVYAPSPGRSYTIPDDKIDEFYTILSKSLFIKKEKISIVEKIQPICRLVIDFDFKYKKKLKTRQYNNSILTKIIQNIFSNIETLYNLSEEQKVVGLWKKKIYVVRLNRVMNPKMEFISYFLILLRKKQPIVSYVN